MTDSFTTKRYYPLGFTVVAVRDSANGALNDLLGDQLGSTTTSVNASTGATTTQRFLPYGAPRSGSITATDRGWIGQTKDASTGLQYLNARYYDPQIGRFTAADPLANLSEPASLDAYGYGHDSPVTLSDPTGLAVPVDGARTERAWDARRKAGGFGGKGLGPKPTKVVDHQKWLKLPLYLRCGWCVEENSAKQQAQYWNSTSGRAAEAERMRRLRLEREASASDRCHDGKGAHPAFSDCALRDTSVMPPDLPTPGLTFEEAGAPAPLVRGPFGMSLDTTYDKALTLEAVISVARDRTPPGFTGLSLLDLLIGVASADVPSNTHSTGFCSQVGMTSGAVHATC